MDENNIDVVKTDEGAKDGQVKCPKCGATDIALNTKTGKLRCNFCRHEFDPVKVDISPDIQNLEGIRIGSGASQIQADTKDVVTLKCSSCGAEVVIDTASATQARCHWCRNTLSINQQVPNGAVPDVVLPFKMNKNEARSKIEGFVLKRKFFAHPTFTKEFTTENICGVYFPYMLVDVNAHMKLEGLGEIQTKRYTVKSGDHEETYYDADSYRVGRDFDIAIDDLSIEASADKLDYSSKDKTTNIINAIMPFDTENCVRYDSNYIKGYTSEKRDTDIKDLKEITETQAADVARHSIKNSISKYDRGVSWKSEDFNIKGESWTASYLPVWLYSYLEKKNGKNLLHYVAVNARNGQTMGSVPINKTKLIITSFIVEILAFLLALLINPIFDDDEPYNWILLIAGIVFYFVMYSRYRNAGASYSYESKTKFTVSNLKTMDVFVEKKKKLKNARIKDENSSEVRGKHFKFNKSDVKIPGLK